MTTHLPAFDAEFMLGFHAAFNLLLEGACLAQDAKLSVWEFAVEVDDLRATGLTKNAVRWLIHKGYAAHAVETTKATDRFGRRFRKIANLVFSSSSCLVFTNAGIDFAERIRSTTALGAGAGAAAPSATRLPPSVVPSWDSNARILRVGDTIVKHFRVPAANQELILSAFEEEGWCPQIDDPLPPVPELDAKRRLHDTINRLNRNQKSRLIRFKGNGNGRAICWEYVRQRPPPN